MNDILNLPEYPAKTDMWEELKKDKRPIVVYGMGNGADKLISRFEKYGIAISDFFASNGFVRGHYFHGFRVKSFSEIKAEYSDFVIVLSFASNKPDVIDMLKDIDKEYEMYVPDMPVAGVEEYFDKNFYNKNYDSILKAYNSLSDERSKNICSAVIHYKLSGKMKYLIEAFTSKEDMYSYISGVKIHNAIDAGAYNGDTAREMKHYLPHLKKVYAIEPDKRNFKKLKVYSEAESDIEIIPINAAVWKDMGAGEFSASGNRNSTLLSTPSFKHRSDAVELFVNDSLLDAEIDLIKYDVEGAEKEALEGSLKLIDRRMPALIISLYHRSKDIFEIINYMRTEYPEYNLYITRFYCLPAWEINLICVKSKG